MGKKLFLQENCLSKPSFDLNLSPREGERNLSFGESLGEEVSP